MTDLIDCPEDGTVLKCEIHERNLAVVGTLLSGILARVQSLSQRDRADLEAVLVGIPPGRFYHFVSSTRKETRGVGQMLTV